jgi:hypothetical protein
MRRRKKNVTYTSANVSYHMSQYCRNFKFFCLFVTVEEDEEEEEVGFSTRELLTQFRGDGDEDNEYEEDYD